MYDNLRAEVLVRRSFPWILGSLVALATLAAPASAQDGWLGLEIRFRGGDTTPVIEGVVPGSPAESAGILAQDRLMEIDGEPASPARFELMRRGLDAGDEVDLVLDRGGQRVVTTLAAIEAPEDIRRQRERISVFLPGRGAGGDSVWVNLQLNLDSLRANLAQINRERLDSIRIRMDSVRVQMDALNDSIREHLDEARLEEMQEQLRRLDIGRVALDAAREAREAALEARERVRVLGLDGDSLRVLIDGLADSVDPFIYGRVDGDSIAALALRGMTFDFDSAWAFPDSTTFAWISDPDAYRFYTPFFAGQRTVAGAELAELNPSLARYFDVDAGVLVVDVADRSPAADGGIEPGDVIVEVNGEPVTSIRDVREIFSRLTFAWPWTVDRDTPETVVAVTVVREGQRRELELRE